MSNQKSNYKEMYENILSRGYKNPNSLIKFNKESNAWEVHKDTLEDIQSVIVIKNFEYNEYLNGLYSAVMTLEPGVAQQWYKNFTKSIFLIGNPFKVINKYPTDVCFCSPNTLIYKPQAEYKYKGLRLLLRPLRAHKKQIENIEFAVGGIAYNKGIKQLDMFQKGLTLERYLVHLTHTFVESVILKKIFCGDLLKIKNCQKVNLKSNALYTRINIDESDRSKLTRYSLLYES